ncbi:hypothetical protein D7X74_04930 [Corallococcus sp. CA047B]|uniref:hypothetical protein n=1 Tax=Corallococcus sp. CA047B TaxID=2316729 RepID=UPI000EBA7D14|nr:hypothetical protein [Corallococcus sp. CA047B]RKH20145.1 hypothetical protein D7X74_04930 [Corallococcus sp. CA047B]
MKIIRPPSSATPSVQSPPRLDPPAVPPPQGRLAPVKQDLFDRPGSPPSAPSDRVLGASGNSVAVGGRGASNAVLSSFKPESAIQAKPDHFEGGSHPFRPVDAGTDPLASGSSVRSGGHSGTVCANFVDPDGKAGEAAPKSKGAEWSSKLARAVAELVKTLQAEPSTEEPAEGARGGRISTGDSSRSSGTTHSKGSQAREGAEEDAAPPQDSSRVASNG